MAQGLTQELGCQSLVGFMSRNMSTVNYGLMRPIFNDSKMFLVLALCDDASVRWGEGSMGSYL